LSVRAVAAGTAEVQARGLKPTVDREGIRVPDNGEAGGQKAGISRRDFLDGVAITAAGLAAAAATPYLTGAEAALAAASKGHVPQPPTLPPGYYPPTSTGITGEPNSVIDLIYKIDGRPDAKAAANHSSKGGSGVHVPVVKESGDVYDCVIVGAGASGLASAKFYQDRFGPDAKILLLDPLPDFGGHSHRNEFHVPNGAAGGADLTILRNGGTVNLDSIGAWNRPSGSQLDIPGSYGQPALDMLAYCGVDINNFPSSTAPGIPASYGLRQMLLFPAADWGTDTLAQNRISATEPNTAAGWTTFVNRLPFSQAAKDAIVRIQTDDTTDWIAAKHGPMSVDEKIQLLTRITYKQYLTNYVGAPEAAIVQYQRSSHGLLGAGAQAVSAADCWMLGQPGFEGLGLGDVEGRTFPGIGRTPQMDNMVDSGPSRAWPDGNTSLLRLLVSKLIPASFPDVDGGRPNQENIVKAVCDYTQLDRPDNTVRIRLNSLVIGVKPAGKNDRFAEVVYTPVGDGKPTGFRVRASHVVMACWNRVTAHLVEDLPKRQVENLCYARKVPLIYGRAALNNWTAWADAKISSVSPRGKSLFWDSTSISAGARFGGAYGPTPNQPPTAPASLTFTVVPNDPLRTPQIAAYESGREMLLNKSFEDLEGALIDVIDRSVNKSGGNFEPERDIHSLMINRWNYGYAHELTSVWDPSLYGPVANQPQVKGRVPFRNVSIANSDSGAMAYTHSAISEGYRAVQDLPEPPPRHRPPHHDHGRHRSAAHGR
jgi:spermidine dehydrogenase